MHRCYIPLIHWRNNFIEPDEHTVHYLINVLRLKKEDKIVVFDGTGREIVGEILSATTRPFKLRIAILQEVSPPTKELQIDFILLQSLPKGNRMDWIVEKAVELGVTTIIPVITERVIPRFESGTYPIKKIERWQRIAESASRQCGCRIVPKIKLPCVLQDALLCIARVDFFAVGSLAPDAKTLIAAMKEKDSIKSMALLIGPEGDLTPAEYNSAIKSGAVPITLGKRVLRVETAAICGITVMMFCASGGSCV